MFAATFDSGGVLEPGWNRVRNATGGREPLVPAGEPIDYDRLERILNARPIVPRMPGCHRCDNGGRKFFDGVDWRCWTCHRVTTAPLADQVIALYSKGGDPTAISLARALGNVMTGLFEELVIMLGEVNRAEVYDCIQRVIRTGGAELLRPAEAEEDAA